MARIRVVRVVLSFALFLHSAAPAFAHFPQRPAVALAGAVFSDGTSQRIAHASIALCDDGGSVLLQSPVNDGGEFSFQGLQPARYILKGQAPGFDSAELHLDLRFSFTR